MGTRYLGDELEISHDVHIEDNGILKIGSASGGDLQIYHNASHSLISNQTGNIIIRNQTNDGDISFQADDQSGGDTTYFTVDGSTGYVRFEDNRRIAVGSGDDLQIKHDGTDSDISNYTETYIFKITLMIKTLYLNATTVLVVTQLI